MDFSNITTPVRVDLLISFTDIQGFSRIAQQLQDLNRLFELLNNWATILINQIETAGGRVIKFIGDSCLSVFPAEGTDAGVRALLSAKQEAETFLKVQGFASTMRVTGHVGEAIVGLFGAGGCRGVDVFGESVNTSAALERNDRRNFFASGRIFS